MAEPNASSTSGTCEKKRWQSSPAHGFQAALEVVHPDSRLGSERLPPGRPLEDLISMELGRRHPMLFLRNGEHRRQAALDVGQRGGRQSSASRTWSR